MNFNLKDSIGVSFVAILGEMLQGGEIICTDFTMSFSCLAHINRRHILRRA